MKNGDKVVCIGRKCKNPNYTVWRSGIITQSKPDKNGTILVDFGKKLNGVWIIHVDDLLIC